MVFKDKDTLAIYEGFLPKRYFKEIAAKARMKIRMLMAAETLMDLRSPPSNHLESLRGNRKGQYSIRINNQFRLCFVWNDGKPNGIEIVDYHK